MTKAEINMMTCWFINFMITETGKKFLPCFLYEFAMENLDANKETFDDLGNTSLLKLKVVT